MNDEMIRITQTIQLPDGSSRQENNSDAAENKGTDTQDSDAAENTGIDKEEKKAKRKKAKKKSKKEDGAKTESEADAEAKGDGTLKPETDNKTDSGSLIDMAAVPKALPYIAVGCLLLCVILAVLLHVKRKRKRQSEQRANKRKSAQEQTMQDLSAQNGNARQAAAGQVENRGQSGVIFTNNVHKIGTRSDQQDSFGLSESGQKIQLGEKGLCAIISDGMGGLANGSEASARTVMVMMQLFESLPIDVPADHRLLQMLNAANHEVSSMVAADNDPGGATVISVIIQNGQLFWLTVGDSHLYLFRDGTLLQINRDHVYSTDLDESAARGEITMEQAAADPQRKALTSYVGMGNIKKIDRNIRPLQLRDHDRIALMTDGVFGTLSDEEIISALQMPISSCCSALDAKIQAKQKTQQDNYTALILEYAAMEA